MITRKFHRTALVAVLALAIMLSVTGGTIAWFTDSVESNNNVIASGNLDVTMEWLDGKEVPTDDAAWQDASSTVLFDYDLWEPGYTEVRHIRIANIGTLALKYQLIIDANGMVSDLADVIDVYYADPAIQITDRTQLTENSKIGTLTEVLAGITSASGNLSVGESETVTLALKMQESAGNDYQGLSIGSDFTVKLYATQLTEEEDSFDDQYDANATGFVIVDSPYVLTDAWTTGGHFYLTKDIEAVGTVLALNGAETVLDLNGQALDLTGVNNFGIAAQNGSSLTLDGDGDVNMYKGFYSTANSEIIVNGGTYDMGDATTTLNKNSNHSIIQNNSSVTINGGNFLSDVENAVQFMLSNNATLEVNGGFFHNTNDTTPVYFAHGNSNQSQNLIYLKGGTFVNWDPSTSNGPYTYFVDLNKYPDNPPLSGSFILLVKGYEIVAKTQENGDVWYSVVPISTP